MLEVRKKRGLQPSCLHPTTGPREGLLRSEFPTTGPRVGLLRSEFFSNQLFSSANIPEFPSNLKMIKLIFRSFCILRILSPQLVGKLRAIPSALQDCN